MKRIYNFSAGPSTLPLPVLEKVQAELLSYQGLGMSVMEMSHRSSYFENILNETEHNLRQLMSIPSNYKVLFVQGGASLQFSMVPMNLLNNHRQASYIHTGSWSEKAIQEASKFGEISILASSKDQNYTYIPKTEFASFPTDQLDYVHITTNNTIEGTRFSQIPDTGSIPLVADMSSNILSEVYDVSKFGLIYAGAQKNLGPAGLTIVIVREDLVGKYSDEFPTMLNYQTYSKSNSMYNTPPTLSIYITKLVLDWLQEQGGIGAMEQMNKEKASILYNFLDESTLFKSKIQKSDRSLMNIPFTTDSSDLNYKFLQESEGQGLHSLEGHRSTGGMRASLYNAMPIDGVKSLVELMKKFEITYR